MSTKSSHPNTVHSVPSGHTHRAKPKADAKVAPPAASHAEASPSVAVAQPVAAVAPASTAAATPPGDTSAPSNILRAIALVKEAITLAGIDTPVLTAPQRRALLKLRKGGESQIPQLAELSTEYGVGVPTRPTADMATNLAQANALAPLLAVVSRFFKVLEDATLQYESEVWTTATTLYSMLKKASVREPALKAELAQLETFFAYRSRSPAASNEPSPKTGASEGATVVSDPPAAATAATQPGTGAAHSYTAVQKSGSARP